MRTSETNQRNVIYTSPINNIYATISCHVQRIMRGLQAQLALRDCLIEPSVSVACPSIHVAVNQCGYVMDSQDICRQVPFVG
jgi:hypothetical protein